MPKSSPVGQSLKNFRFTLPWQSNAAGEQHRRRGGITGAIFVITDQWEPTAGKLYPDLVASAGVEPNVHQAGFPGTKAFEFQPGFLNTAPLPFHHEDFVLFAVLP